MSGSLILLIILLFALILLSGFFSGSETALTATSKPRILLKFKKGNNPKIVNFVKNYNNAVLDDILS